MTLTELREQEFSGESPIHREERGNVWVYVSDSTRLRTAVVVFDFLRRAGVGVCLCTEGALGKRARQADVAGDE